MLNTLYSIGSKSDDTRGAFYTNLFKKGVSQREVDLYKIAAGDDLSFERAEKMIDEETYQMKCEYSDRIFSIGFPFIVIMLLISLTFFAMSFKDGQYFVLTIGCDIIIALFSISGTIIFLSECLKCEKYINAIIRQLLFNAQLDERV